MIRCRRLATVVTILMLAVSCTSQHDPHAGMETGDDNAVVDAVFASWDVPGSPGCAVAVAQDGALVYSRGYGYANLDYDIPITPALGSQSGASTTQKTSRLIVIAASRVRCPGLRSMTIYPAE